MPCTKSLKHVVQQWVAQGFAKMGQLLEGRAVEPR